MTTIGVGTDFNETLLTQMAQAGGGHYAYAANSDQIPTAIEQELGALGSLSAVNVAGFDWDSDQNFTFAQDAVPGNRIFLYCVFFDIFPKGV